MGKRFRRNWVFRNIEYNFRQGGKYAILGANGSGKSTILQIISGLMMTSEGNVSYSKDGNEVGVESVYNRLCYAAPYMTLFEQLTLEEQVGLHFEFRNPVSKMSLDSVLDKLELGEHRLKQIQDFSSGMKQRLKLGLALMTDSDLVLLDEPLSNLDEKGRRWYHKMVNEFIGSRTVIVCSNKQEEEYNFCTEVLSL